MTRSIVIEEELTERAMRAWLQRCNREGWLHQQPSKYTSGVENGHVVLANGHGELARYRITPRGLRYVEATS